MIFKIGWIILCAALFSVCSGNRTSEKQEPPGGVVYGTVTIGPTRPVETNRKNPEEAKRFYKGRTVLIYSVDNKNLVKSIPLDEHGKFRLSLAPGSYVLKMKLRMPERSNLPKKIEIKSGETIEVNIDIDTGIR